MAIFRGIGGAGDSTTDATVTAVTQQAVNAANSATAAASSASSAASSAADAATSEINAAASAVNAATSETNAAQSATNAAASESASAASETASAASETAAAASETAAASSASAASTSATNAASSESAAASSAIAAASSATSAANSATAAAATETAVAASAVAAANSATDSAASATASASSASAASASEAAAASSESNAASSATAAAASASASATNATASETSALAASGSETAAAASETNAASSAASAAASATAAATSANNAANSELAASASASAAATSESNAASSETNAAASAASAAASYDSFDDRYLGDKTSDPSVDNDGNALLIGALYFDTSNSIMKVYNGSAWVAAYASSGGALLNTNNLSDLTNVAAARTNLGLGTTDNVVFGSVETTDGLTVSGDLTVNGTLTTVNTENLAVSDNMIYLNEGSTITNPDLGWAGNYNDGTYAHAGIFRDATDGVFKFYDGYTPEPGTSIDTSHASFSLADVAANSFSGSLDGNAVTATRLANARNIELSGDASGSISFDGSADISINTTLANTGVTAGVYGSSTNIPQVIVDSKGRLTSVSNVAVSIPSGSLTFTGDVTGTGSTGSTTTLTLANSGVTSGTYGSNDSIPSLTFDAKGRATGATTVTPSGTWGISITGNAATATNATYATTAGSAPASDVYAWAKAATKPSYTYSEVGAPATDGTNASGTWGINITGNAATASNGGVTSVNGQTGAVTIATGMVDGGSYSTLYLSNWFRSTGQSGWYNQTYGGGMYMIDTTWVRVYASKAFYVGNEIAAAGNITAYYSDMRLKTKTGKIENALDKVEKLEGFYYVENELAKSLGYNNDKQQVALSAQAVKEVMPEAVSLAAVDMETLEDGTIQSKSGEDYLTVDYARLVPLLVEAIKELKAEVKKLKGE